MQAGIEKTLVFDGAVTLTHSAAGIVLPDGANLTTAAGDVLRFRSEGGGKWKCVGHVASLARILRRDETKALSVGYETPVLAHGDLGAVTFTPNIRLRALQSGNVTGNLTIAPPTYEGEILLELTNNGASFTVTLDAAYTKISGEYTAGGTLKHNLYLRKVGATVSCVIEPVVAA
jgi:hypothetical protein